jgi:hypothetical protein
VREHERPALLGVARIALLIDVSARSITGVSAPCGLWQSEHFILFSMIGWCDGFIVAARTCWWHVPQSRLRSRGTTS